MASEETLQQSFEIKKGPGDMDIAIALLRSDGTLWFTIQEKPGEKAQLETFRLISAHRSLKKGYIELRLILEHTSNSSEFSSFFDNKLYHKTFAAVRHGHWLNIELIET